MTIKQQLQHPEYHHPVVIQWQEQQNTSKQALSHSPSSPVTGLVVGQSHHSRDRLRGRCAIHLRSGRC